MIESTSHTFESFIIPLTNEISGYT